MRGLVCRLLPVGCGLAFFVVLALFSGSAAALEVSARGAGSEVPAPMCDPDGASVAAADDIPEVDRGRFEALPCEAQLLLAGFRPGVPEPGSKAVSVRGTEPSSPPPLTPPQGPRYEGARALVAVFPSRAEPRVGDFAAGAGLAASVGHAPAPFRPPLARV